MQIIRAIAAIALAGASFAVSAGGFRIINNGVGQRGFAPLQPVVIEFFGGNEVTFVSARYLYDTSRLRLVSIQPQGSFSCTSPGAGAIDVTGNNGGGGICLVLLEPLVTPYGSSFINAVSLGCSPFPFGGFCNSPGPGSYFIIGPRMSPAANSAITLTSSVGLPSPTQGVLFTNNGDSGSNLVITAGGSNAVAAVTPSGTGAVLGRLQSRNYTLFCNTATAGTTTTNITFAHNANPMDPTPIIYALQCRIRIPPTLTYAPTTGTLVSIPGSAASVRTAEIGITVSGGETQGARTLACTVPSGYAVTVEPGLGASSTFSTGGANGRIRLGCNSAALPANGTLSCTESGSPTRTWPISCAIDEAFTATPSFATPVVLKGLVGGPSPTHSFTVTNTGTEATSLALNAPTGLSGALSISPSTPQAVAQGAAGVPYVVTCSSLAAFSGTQTLSIAHDAPDSPSQLAVTCNMLTPPTLAYAPSFGNAVQVSASVGAQTPTTNIRVTTTGGDPGGERSLACSINQSNYSLLVDTSPFATGAAGNIRLGCDSINQQAATLSCTETPGGTLRQWPLTCANTAVYTSSPRPGSAIGVYFPIGATGFVDADVAVSNKGTANLSVTNCVQTPTLFFGVEFTPNPIAGNSNGTLNVTCPQPAQGSADFRTLTCNTSDPTRQSIVYKLICVAPPTTDPGEGASPEERLTSPTPDSGAKLGSSTVIATLDNGDEIVVVGAPNGGADGDGRVYVYVRVRGAGAAGQLADAKRAVRGFGKPVAVLRAPANRGKAHAKGIGNKFGEDVAISNSGTFIAVGAPTGGGSNTGEVLVFSMPQGGWGDLGALVPVVVAPPAVPGVVASDFGSHVEFAPDGMLVVGAPGAIVSAVDNAGAAFMFQTNGTAVGAPITATSPEPGAAFGTSLDVSTGMLAVGAPGENNSTGAAYFFEIDASSTVGPANRQTATGGSFGDKWGTEVAIGGASIIVGAPDDDTAAGQNSGSATVFRQGDGNTVALAATLIPPSGGTQGAGAAIATNGDVVVLGAPFSDVSGNNDRGRAIVYDLEAAAVGIGTPAGVYENTIGEAGDEFGSAIAISRGRLLLGAPLSDEGPDVDEGRVDPFELDRIFRGNFDF